MLRDEGPKVLDGLPDGDAPAADHTASTPAGIASFKIIDDKILINGRNILPVQTVLKL